MTPDIILLMLTATLIGSLLGTAIGMLPGLGPTSAIAMTMPAVISSPPEFSLPFIAALYYGTQYGGSTTAILFKIPGESSSVVLCLDGHEYYKKGRAGAALTVAALGSFFAGLVTCGFVWWFSPFLAKFSTYFTPVEVGCLSMLGLYFATTIFSQDKVMSMYATAIGLLIGTIGVSFDTGETRFTRDIYYLYDGVGFVVLVAGLLGLPEILNIILTNQKMPKPTDFKIGWSSLTTEEKKESIGSTGRGTLVGGLLGLIPGGGATIGSYFAYAFEKYFTRGLGKGKIAGIASPESANNAGVQTAFIPLLSLGIPENAAMALILGMMMQQGIPFGPRLFVAGNELVFILVVSMLIGNLMLVIFNLPLIKHIVKIYRVPQKILFGCAGLLLLICVYSIQENVLDIIMLLFFGIIGLAFKKLDIPTLPIVMGFVLGRILEDRVVKSLVIHNGDLTVFLFNGVTLAVIFFSICFYIFKLSFKKFKNRQLDS